MITGQRAHPAIENPGQRIESSPGKVTVASETEASSESPKEFHNRGVISPPFFDPAIAASWITRSESLSFHGQVCFRIDVGGVKRDVAQPRPDCVEINASTKQVGCCRMA